MNSINVRQVIADIRGIDVSAASPEASFDTLGLSSLDMVALLVRVEDLLGFSIPYGELASIDSLGGLERLISTLQTPPHEIHNSKKKGD